MLIDSPQVLFAYKLICYLRIFSEDFLLMTLLYCLLYFTWLSCSIYVDCLLSRKDTVIEIYHCDLLCAHVSITGKISWSGYAFPPIFNFYCCCFFPRAPCCNATEPLTTSRKKKKKKKVFLGCFLIHLVIHFPILYGILMTQLWVMKYW